MPRGEPDRRRPVVDIRDFVGLAPNADAADIPPGSARAQDNAASNQRGRLRCRRGIRVVEFDQEA